MPWSRSRRGAAWRSSPTRCAASGRRSCRWPTPRAPRRCARCSARDAPREIAIGAAGLDAVATADADLVVAALVGAAGLRPTLAAVRAGRDVALANKEVLVMAGALVRREVAARGVTLLPVDSEHSAIFQALAGARPRGDREADPHRVGRAVPHLERGADRARERRGGAAPPELGHGAEDHDRLRDADEQGPRGDRGALAVRRRARAHRGGRAPAVDRALAGRVLRHLGDRAARPARHARADRGRARAPGAPAARPAAARPRRGRPARLRDARHASASRASSSPIRRCAATRPRPRC